MSENTALSSPSAAAAKAVKSAVKSGKPRRQFDFAFKQRAVQRAKIAGVPSVARDIQVAESVLRNWTHGKGIGRPGTGLPKGERALIKKAVKKALQQPGVTRLANGRRAFTEQYKRAAVERWDAGETSTAIAADLKINTGQLVGWRDELHRKDGGIGKGKRQYKKNASSSEASAGTATNVALAIRDTITYLKHVKADIYALLESGTIKEFEEYHLNTLAALKRLQGVG